MPGRIEKHNPAIRLLLVMWSNYVGQANEILVASALKKMIIVDTIPSFRLNEKVIKEKLQVVDSARLLADAIQCVHSGNLMVELLEI